MKVVILAVTKARYGEFCIAGMTEEGKWIRPIPDNSQTRFWTQSQITTSKNGILRSGDVLEIEGFIPDEFEHQNHIEDFVVTNRKLVKRLSNDELITFLKGKEESENAFITTVNAQGRSLCLIKVDNLNHYTTKWEDDPEKPKMTFSYNLFDVNNPKTDRGDYIVKDCKWSNLVLNKNLPSQFEDIYVCIGLATPSPFNSVEYPQVIGLHTNVDIPLPSSYPQ